MKEYSCRTEETSGIEYTISLWSDASKEQSGSMAFYNSWEEADQAGKRMMEHLPKGKYQVNAHPWKKTVCIECGQEAW